MKVITDVRKKDVILYCGTHNDQHFMQLMDVASACAKLGARSLAMLIPYFGYSTMERATKTGEIVKAKIRARMLSTIPQAKEGNTILFLDLHADGIPHYLEGDTQGFHLYSEKLITDTIKQLMVGAKEEFCIGSTDAGRSKWVQSLARELKVRAVTAQKTRLSGSKVALDSIEGSFRGETVIIYDDMIRTGGSLLQAARGYREKGAGKVIAIATHGVLPGNALLKLLDARYEGKPLIETIHVTDSLPGAPGLKALNPQVKGRFKIIPTTNLWIQGIKKYL